MIGPLALTVAGLIGTVAGDILWDGRFNDYNSSTDFDEWSWSNQVGDYQYYIHGTDDVTEYINLSSDYKNPADSGSTQGAKITLTNTSYWEGQTMRRTELIPQTTAAINSGQVYYHFSISRSDTNAPSTGREHQIAFFESHFTELKYGLISGESGTADGQLRWDVGGVSQWNTTFDADVWHNVAFAIDFDAGTVAFYHSTGADDLTQTVSAVSASASSNGEDWHVGVLELASTTGAADTTEDLFFSGVYIESGDLTTSVSGPGTSGSSSSESSSSVAATSQASTSVAVAGSTSVAQASTSAVAATSSVVAVSSSVAVASSSVAAATSVAAVSSAAATSVAAVSSVAAASSSPVAVSSFVTSVVPASSVAAASSSAVVLTPSSASSVVSSTAATSTAKACKRKKRTVVSN